MLGELVQAWLRVALAACGVDGEHARAHAANALAARPLLAASARSVRGQLCSLLRLGVLCI